MSRRRWMRSACVALAVLAWPAAAPTADVSKEPADVILSGGRVWTAAEAQPWAEAVAVRGDRIAFVGSSAGAAALRGPRTQVVDLAGRLVTPGFNDAHLHLMSGSLSLERVDLIEDQDTPAVQERIRAFAAANPKNAWVLGRGWLYGSFAGGLPTREQLDAVVPDRPAYMECYDGHSGWANSKALALAGITKDTPSPPRGEIVKDAKTGEPTGALKESATSLVEAKIPAPGVEERYALLLRALRLLNSQGLTSVQDAGYGPDEFRGELPLLERALKERALTVRLKASIRMSPGAADAAVAEASWLAARPPDPFLRFGTVKGFVDGVIEAHTAAMLEPYSDDPKLGRGEPNWDAAALNAAVTAADRAGLQVYLHAIGDRGVRMALDAHEAAARANGPRDRRGRIEHIETIDPADIARFGALGVIAAQQPYHGSPAPNQIDVWKTNLGEPRASRSWVYNSLLSSGAHIAFGSDWPVVSLDPRLGLHVATTRTSLDGLPEGGWIPTERLTLAQAIDGYTSAGAWASFDEQRKGTLERGMLADIVILTSDIFEPGARLLDSQVALTIFDGRVVFDREQVGKTE